MSIPLKNGLCVACNDGIPKPVIGKREKALCGNHYYGNLRAKSNPIPKKSDTRIDEDKIYMAVRKVFLNDNKKCVVKTENCSGAAETVHHTKGHDQYYLDVETWLPVCLNCHRPVEINPDWAKEHYFSQDRLTPFKIALPFDLKIENSIRKLEQFAP